MEPVDAEALEWTELDREETQFRRKQLSEAAAAEDPELGCSLYELPAGAKSWPYHYHEANTEVLYVLAGEGQVRLGEDHHRIEAGSFLYLPADETGAHRVVNDADGPLRYLAVSTMEEPDVTVYPDSDKIGVFAGSPPGGRAERSVAGYFRRTEDVSYWDGEG